MHSFPGFYLGEKLLLRTPGTATVGAILVSTLRMLLLGITGVSWGRGGQCVVLVHIVDSIRSSHEALQDKSPTLCASPINPGPELGEER